MTPTEQLAAIRERHEWVEKTGMSPNDAEKCHQDRAALLKLYDDEVAAREAQHHAAINTTCDLERRLERQAARIGELEKALLPFAKAADIVDRLIVEHAPIEGIPVSDEIAMIPAARCREARSALSPSEGKKP